MKNGYFVYNNKQYPTGTIIVVKQFCNSSNKERYASFIYHDAERNEYSYCFRDNGQRWTVSSEIFYNNLVKVTNIYDGSIHMPELKQFKDKQINGLFIGWLWYILFMGISLIFYNRILLWIFISFVFFNWRKNKIEKEGYYVEW